MKNSRTQARTGDGWVLSRSAKSLWADFRSQTAALSSRHWARWALVLGLGFAACTVLVWAITRTGQRWAGNGLQAWDERMLARLVEWAPMEFADAIMYESPGNLLYIAPLIVVAVVIAVRRKFAIAGISLFVGYLLQRPLVIFGWMMWDRARPEMVAGGVAAPGFHSFPSGHIAMGTFVYGFLAYLWARATPHPGERVLAFLLAFAWIVMMGVGRLRLGTHWPSDMVAGFLVAVPWLAVVVFAQRALEKAGAGTAARP